MPDLMTLPDFTQDQLPIFPAADKMTITNNIISGKRFGQIKIEGAAPEIIYFFGNLTEGKIAGRAYVRTNLTLSHGMKVVKHRSLWNLLKGATPGMNEASIDFKDFETFAIGKTDSNRVIPVCLHLLPASDNNYQKGIDLEFCPVSILHGGNGICTKITGDSWAEGANIEPPSPGEELDRLVFSIEEKDLPDEGKSGEEPKKRLLKLCDARLNRLVTGYFIMPLLCPDLSVIYSIYPNVKKSRKTKYPSRKPPGKFPTNVCPTRTILKKWYELEGNTTIGVDGLKTEVVEEMHTFLCHDVNLFVENP